MNLASIPIGIMGCIAVALGITQLDAPLFVIGLVIIGYAGIIDSVLEFQKIHSKEDEKN